MASLDEKQIDAIAAAAVPGSDLNAVEQVPFLPPRQNFVTTAVKFLLNPRVRRTSLALKQAFLRQKGLTAEEIELACAQAGAYTDEQNNNSQSQLAQPPVAPLPVVPYNPKLGFWIKARDTANLVALFSIGSYSLYFLWKRFISPRLFGTTNTRDQHYHQLLDSIFKLNESVAELKTLVRALRPSTASVSRSRENSAELQDLRAELTSIKGLLLNRNQFPSSPGIPSWQMLDTDEAGGDQEPGRRRKDRKLGQRKCEDEDTGAPLELGGPAAPPSTRKQSSSVDLDSNNGFNSGSSCEVVFMGGKNDSNSDPDHSDD